MNDEEFEIVREVAALKTSIGMLEARVAALEGSLTVVVTSLASEPDYMRNIVAEGVMETLRAYERDLDARHK